MLMARVTSVSRALAPRDTLLDLVQAGPEVRDAVDDVVGAALEHARVGALALLLALRRVHRLHVLEREPYLVTAHREPDGPHAGVEAFLDAGDGVVDLDAGVDRGDLKVDDVLQAHVRVRTAGRDIAGADGRVRHIALAPGIVQVDLHHFGRVARGRPDPDPACAHGRNRVE